VYRNGNNFGSKKYFSGGTENPACPVLGDNAGVPFEDWSPFRFHLPILPESV